MRKRSLLAFLFILLNVSTFQWATAQKASPKPEVLVSFGNGQTITREEFEFVYAKNNGGVDAVRNHTPKQYQDYLDLYINFRRKVMEAERLGMDTAQAFRTELQGYLDQIAQPYLIERNFLSQLIEEAYLRSQTEVYGQRIVLPLAPGASPADTLTAWQKALAIRDSIVSKKLTFETAAQRHSKHPQAKLFGADMGWSTVFDQEYSLESILYNLAVGAVSPPIRVTTGNNPGYYLYTAKAKAQNPGTKRVAHVVIRWGTTYTAKDSQEALIRIGEVYNKLKQGEEWSALVTEYSDDPQTRNRGGDLGSIRLIPPMEIEKQKLNPGQYSMPFQTPYGWHILMVTDLTPVKMGDAGRAEMRQRVLRDKRAKLAEENFIANLKKETNYTQNDANRQTLLAALGTQTLQKLVNPDSVDARYLNTEIIRFANKGYDLRGFLQFAGGSRKVPLSKTLNEIWNTEVGNYGNNLLIDFEKARLNTKYPDFRRTAREYRDGILLFSLTENNVWRKALEDTTGLRSFFEANKDSFPATERVRVREFSAFDTTALQELQRLYRERPLLTVLDSFITRTKLQVRTYERTFDKNNSAIAREAYTQPKGFVSRIVKDGNRYFYYIILDFLPAGTKLFAEAKPEAITKYQTYLEKNWLQSLRQRYPVRKQNTKLLAKLYK